MHKRHNRESSMDTLLFICFFQASNQNRLGLCILSAYKISRFAKLFYWVVIGKGTSGLTNIIVVPSVITRREEQDSACIIIPILWMERLRSGCKRAPCKTWTRKVPITQFPSHPINLQHNPTHSMEPIPKKLRMGLSSQLASWQRIWFQFSRSSYKTLMTWF